jgi:hypothetical protein
MEYLKIRDQIKTGDALLFSGGNWKSWYGFQVMMVRMFKPSEWSHIGMAWVAHNRVFIMESVGNGIRLFPLSRELPFGWVSRPKELSEFALDWAFAHIAVKYPAKWKMVLNKGFGLHIDEEGALDCSDFFMGILEQDGEILDCPRDPTSILRELMQHWGSLSLVEQGEVVAVVEKI